MIPDCEADEGGAWGGGAIGCDGRSSRAAGITGNPFGCAGCATHAGTAPFAATDTAAAAGDAQLRAAILRQARIGDIQRGENLHPADQRRLLRLGEHRAVGQQERLGRQRAARQVAPHLKPRQRTGGGGRQDGVVGRMFEETVRPERQHIGRRGEDITAGTALLSQGRLLRPQDVGVLSSIGIRDVPVEIQQGIEIARRLGIARGTAQARLDRLATRGVIEEALAAVLEVRAEGNGRLAQLLDLMYLGDWTSLYMAYDAGVDPGPIDAIGRLKDELSP